MAVSSNIQKARSLIRKWLKCDSGSLTPIFCIAAVPMFAAAGVAIDYNRALYARTALQALADNAALAGAAHDGTAAQQKMAAQTYLAGQELDIGGVDYTAIVTTGTKSVKVVIDGHMKGSLLPVAFSSNSGGHNTGMDFNDIPVDVSAQAKYIKDTPKKVCMLTLNSHDADAMYFRGSGAINASGCGFQSDSDHLVQSLHLQGNAIATAEFFHTVGGWDKTGTAGSFSTTPKNSATKFGDPFNLNVSCPTASGSSVTVSGNASLPTSLSDNIYNNITARNNNVGAFTSGVHYIKGTLSMTNGGLLTGNNVTLVLCGPNAKIDLNGGSLQLQAPATGTYAGFAVVASENATAVNTLQGGPTTWLRGIWYTPKAKLNINGNASFNVNSKYFPIIADKVEIGGTGEINIGMDYAAYGFAEPTQLNLPLNYTVWLQN